MSITKNQLLSSLDKSLPRDILEDLVQEYEYIKQQFFLRKFQPAELNGGRFSECILRLLEYLDTNSYTPLEGQLNSNAIINKIENNTLLTDTFRFFLPRLTRVVLDVRNKRDVAHVGGEVSPNYSDSLFVVQTADWIMTEIVRHFYDCSIDEAQYIVAAINEIQIPIVHEIDDFVRVLNTSLDYRDTTLIILYYKQPGKVSDKELLEWTEYKNSSRYRKDILAKLHKEALIHYKNQDCSLIPKGIVYVEKNIPMSVFVE